MFLFCFLFVQLDFAILLVATLAHTVEFSALIANARYFGFSGLNFIFSYGFVLDIYLSTYINKYIFIFIYIYFEIDTYVRTYLCIYNRIFYARSGKIYGFFFQLFLIILIDLTHVCCDRTSGYDTSDFDLLINYFQYYILKVLFIMIY